jgi:hypothetical protein
MTIAPEVTELRLQLRKAGFHPIPVKGKSPPGKAWETKFNTTTDEIRLWGKPGFWHLASNTGILAKFAPGLDIDIMIEPAAKAVEMLAREFFEEHGDIYVRFGLPPKRLIPLRTDEPFTKLFRVFTAPDGSSHKIEILGDGQQYVVDGIHPDTNKPYGWFGADLKTIKRENLPYVRREDGERFLDAAVELLIRDFGFAPAAERPKRAKRKSGNGRFVNDQLANEHDWQVLLDGILKGTNLHDATRDMAAKWAPTGMDAGAAVNQLRALMELSEAPHDERWQKRFDDIPRLVDSAWKKYAPKEEEPEEEEPPIITPPPRQPPPPPPPPPPPGTGPSVGPAPSGPQSGPSAIETARAVVDKWLVLPSPTAFYALVGTIAANILPGDPVWLGLVAPPSSAKTELLDSVKALPNMHSTGNVTLAGLLSGTPKKQQAATATGGLLREVGQFGILLLKDFGSILSMRPDAKAEVLGALREIFDGAWTRTVGTDGGKKHHWKGKVGLVFGVTGAIDVYHSVDDVLGNRYLLSRLGPDKRQGEFALRHTGASASIMRKELADAMKALFAAPRYQPHPVTTGTSEFERLDKLTKLVVRLRAPTARDRYRRELEYVYGAEGTGRLILSLNQLLTGLDVLGLERATSLDVIESIAMDSVPPMRRTTYEFLCNRKDLTGAFKSVSTPAIAEALDYPTSTIKRVLEDLAV